MNREIKFRAWFDNGKAQDMFFVGDAYGTTHPLDCCRYAQDGQPVTLMQFTGLKDANGVDVYDGDIIRDEEGYLSKIYWHERDFMWGVSEIGGLCELTGSVFVVIGNIYQNPELLK